MAQQQKYFPRHSMVTWNDNEYRVEEIERRTDDTLWSLIEPTDPALRTKWVPNFELKELEIPNKNSRPTLETMATEAAGEIRAREVIKAVLQHVTGFDWPDERIPQEAIDAVTEYGSERWQDGIGQGQEAWG